jgi:hypothetical protein
MGGIGTTWMVPSGPRGSCGVPVLVQAAPVRGRAAADELERRRADLGISYFTVNAAFIEQFAPVMELLSGRSPGLAGLDEFQSAGHRFPLG